MRGQRSAAAVLAASALLLAACDSSAPAASTSQAPVSFPSSSRQASGDGVIDTTIATDELSSVAGADRWIRGLAIDTSGAAVVLLEPHSQQGGFALARVGADSGWKSRPITRKGHVLGLGLGVGGDGTLVTSQEQGENVLAVTRTGTAGTHTVTVPGHLPLGLGVTATALSADGHTAYVSAYQQGQHVSQLLAVDTAKGTVTGTAQLDPTRYVRAIVVLPDRSLVLAMDGINSKAPTATVVRLDAALHVVGTAPVAAASGLSTVDGLAVAPDGTVWLTVLDGLSKMPDTKLHLEVLHPGGAPTVVATWSGAGYAVEPVRVNDLAVNPKDGTIWLLGAPGTDEESQVSITPVSPAGKIGNTVEVDTTGYGSAFTFSKDGNEAYIAGNHNGTTDRGSGPVLWTVG